MQHNDELVQKFTKSELAVAWINREVATEKTVIEKGESLYDHMISVHERWVEFNQLTSDRIEFWIDHGPYSIYDFED